MTRSVKPNNRLIEETVVREVPHRVKKTGTRKWLSKGEFGLPNRLEPCRTML
jgi:hypothetical protein